MIWKASLRECVRVCVSFSYTVSEINRIILAIKWQQISIAPFS